MPLLGGAVFRMGSDDAFAYPDDGEGQLREVELDAFWIGRSPARVALRELEARLDRERGVGLQPGLQLSDRDQPASTTTHHAQLVHDVLLEEVDADAQGIGRLALRQRQAAQRSHARLRSVVLDPARGSHATTSDEPSFPHPRVARPAIPRGSRGAVRPSFQRP